MGEKIICTRIGKGTEDDPYRPDTEAKHWQVVEEKENEFVIEVLEE